MHLMVLHIGRKALLILFPAGPKLCTSLWSCTAAAAATAVKLQAPSCLCQTKKKRGLHPFSIFLRNITTLDWTKWARSTQHHQLAL